jgi:hypothetical protein
MFIDLDGNIQGRDGEKLKLVLITYSLVGSAAWHGEESVYHVHR